MEPIVLYICIYQNLEVELESGARGKSRSGNWLCW